jgi:uncharacterized membrane protein
MLIIAQSYSMALATFLIIDLFWLNVAAKELYRRALTDYLAPQATLAPGIILYALLVAGLTYFVILPAQKDKNMPLALMRAAFLGVICYATYDLTNLAIARSWPLSVTIIDIIWGAVLMMSTTAITLILIQKYRSR